VAKDVIIVANARQHRPVAVMPGLTGSVDLELIRGWGRSAGRSPWAEPGFDPDRARLRRSLRGADGDRARHPYDRGGSLERLSSVHRTATPASIRKSGRSHDRVALCVTGHSGGRRNDECQEGEEAS
jgi:hypothetical protein